MRRRLALGSVLFLAFAGAGIAFAIRGARPEGLGALSGGAWALLALLVPAVYALDALRYRVIGAAAGAPIGWAAALEASVANFFFSWLTPGAAMGAPAAIVTLGRRGVPLAAAGLVAFGKSATGTLALLALAFLALALGLGPAPDTLVGPLATGAFVVTAALALPVAAARLPRLRAWLGRPRPGWRGRLAAGVGDAAARLAGLRPGAYLLIFISHLLYFAAFIGVAVVAVGALGGQPLAQVAGASTVFTAFSYVAPTPGGAGLTEGAAGVFFGALVGPGRAVAAVLLVRGLTFYLQIGVGLVYVLAAGGLRIFAAARP